MDVQLSLRLRKNHRPRPNCDNTYYDIVDKFGHNDPQILTPLLQTLNHTFLLGYTVEEIAAQPPTCITLTLLAIEHNLTYDPEKTPSWGRYRRV